MYGGQTPSLYPPPPSGYPPLAFAAPPPAPAPERAPGPAPLLPPPVHEIDLGIDVDVTPSRPSPAPPPPPPQARTGARTGPVLVLLLAVAGGGAYLAAPALLAKRPPPAPAPPEHVAIPLTIEVRPIATTEPLLEFPPVPVPAPALEAQPGVALAPEPIAKTAKPAPRGPKALLAQARKLLEHGEVQAALELYGRVAEQDPGNAAALTGRALCYLDLESWAPAEASFLAALRLEPDEPDALLGLAEAYRSQGKQAEAIARYEQYLVRHPDGEEAEVAKNALAELRK